MQAYQAALQWHVTYFMFVFLFIYEDKGFFLLKQYFH